MKTKTALFSAALLGALTAFGTVSYGQDASPAPAASPMACCDKGGPGGPGGPRHDMLKFLDKAVGLTDAQKDQLKPILEASRAQIKAAIDDNSLSKADTRAKVKAIHADTKAKVDAILTAEQKQKLADLKAKHKGGKGPDAGAAADSSVDSQ